MYPLSDIKVMHRKNKADMELLRNSNTTKYQFAFAAAKDRDEIYDMLESLWMSTTAKQGNRNSLYRANTASVLHGSVEEDLDKDSEALSTDDWNFLLQGSKTLIY